MTYVDSKTPNWQNIPSGVEQLLYTGPNGALSVPSAHPDPSGGMVLEFSLWTELNYSGVHDPYYAGSNGVVTPVMIDYNLSNSTSVIVERQDPWNIVNGFGGPSKATLIWNVPKHDLSTHAYRIRFLVKHETGLEGEVLPLKFKVQLRGLTQL